jgi:CHAT domain-containing protein/Flp pilus assembly protein TadD
MFKTTSAILISLAIGLTGLGAMGLNQPVMAQTAGGKAEAVRLMQQILQQLQSGQFEAAIPNLQQVLKISQTIQDPTGECLALSGLANANASLGQYDRSTAYFQQGLTVARKHQLRELEAGLLGDLARNYESVGKYDQALATQQQSLAIAREQRDRIAEATTLNALGLLYVALGNDQKATQHYIQALAIAQQEKSQLLTGSILDNLGGVARRTGDYAQAFKFQQQALALHRATNNRIGEMITLAGLGNTAFSLKRYDEALKYQEQSLKIAQASNTPAVQAQTLLNIAASYDALQNADRAIDFTQQGLAIANKINNQSLKGFALTNLGDLFLRRGNLTEAEKSIQAAIPILDSLRAGLNDTNKVTLVENQARIYRLLQEVLIQQKRPESALEAAERGRARAFIELLGSRHSNATSQLQLAQAPKLEQIRRIAKDQNATLVEYSIVKPDLLYIWVIKPTGEIIFRASPIDPLLSLKTIVTQGRSEIGVRASIQVGSTKLSTETPTEATQANLQKLHQLLIEPIAQDLPTNPDQQVIFLPQGEIFLVPFAALPNAQGQQLIEKHTLSTAPSIQTLEFTQAQAQRSKKQGDVLIVGDPQMPKLAGKQLSPLPGARQEAITIGKLLNTAPILGEQATKPVILKKMQSARIMHFATHGLLDTVQGDIPGAIALAPSANDSGLLSAGEIFDLKLNNADLVVLSACDTGRGEITGDGVVGLSRSFVAAGAPSVLVSLWAVDDSSTSELMGELYRQLQSQPNKAQALRQAMLKIRRQKPNPFYWAAFTLIGEAK